MMSVLADLLETWMAVGILGMDVPNAFALGLFAVLGVAAIATVTLLFITMFGTTGLVLGVLFTTIFGGPISRRHLSAGDDAAVLLSSRAGSRCVT